MRSYGGRVWGIGEHRLSWQTTRAFSVERDRLAVVIRCWHLLLLVWRAPGGAGP